MPHHSAHHWIRAKRLTQKQQRSLIKRTVLAIAIIEPITTIPQIYTIWAKGQTEGVSALTWGLYMVGATVWLLYGIQLKDRALIVSSILWILADVAVVVGAVTIA